MTSSSPSDTFPLHTASREGRLAAVEALLSTNPKLASQHDSDSRLPIHWSCSYNHLPITKLLSSSRSFDPDAQDASGWTCLMMSSSLKDNSGLETVEFLFTKDADPKIVTGTGGTALHFAASKGNLEVCKTLLKHGASARVKDKRGQTPLHRAAAAGSVPIVKVLLDAKSAVNASDMVGMTALHHAVSEGNGDVAVELLKRGAETDKKDADGRTPMECVPDAKVRTFILQSAEREGIDLE